MAVDEVHGLTQRAPEAGLYDLESNRPRIHVLKE